ncbi:hypothetical protein [Glutamicibacter creatinolyticus]|uniref:hypothetical protein n=1 Tax=Glutamicibacter creatinolyticus TaxID=162496 RepID=UPI00321630B5
MRQKPTLGRIVWYTLERKDRVDTMPAIVVGETSNHPDYLDLIVFKPGVGAVTHWGVPYSPTPAHDSWTWPVIDR